jgi:hypothetical protein
MLRTARLFAIRRLLVRLVRPALSETTVTRDSMLSQRGQTMTGTP